MTELERLKNLIKERDVLKRAESKKYQLNCGDIHIFRDTYPDTTEILLARAILELYELIKSTT
jgi:hypothetical protein